MLHTNYSKRQQPPYPEPNTPMRLSAAPSYDETPGDVWVMCTARDGEVLVCDTPPELEDGAVVYVHAPLIEVVAWYQWKSNRQPAGFYTQEEPHRRGVIHRLSSLYGYVDARSGEDGDIPLPRRVVHHGHYALLVPVESNPTD